MPGTNLTWERKMGHAFSAHALLIIKIIFLLAVFIKNNVSAKEIEFNMDVLDVKDKENIDLSVFSSAGFILPGEYMMVVQINTVELPEQVIHYFSPDHAGQQSIPCITPALVEQFGLKNAIKKTLSWQQGEQCLEFESIPGVVAVGSLATSKLTVSVPRMYLEYHSNEWDPPSRWDEGISGILADYNLNFNSSHPDQAKPSYMLGGNGVVGLNTGPWRVRAEWQGRIDHTTGNSKNSDQQFVWTRYSMSRAVPDWHSRFELGEMVTTSSLFENFRFLGFNLRTDQSMLPPGLRGYAPEVSGIAKTNARVVLRQQGRIIYETQVAAGAFHIQELNEAVSGRIHVQIEESDGSRQDYEVDTASVPYLTRPGQVRYNFASGQISSFGHQVDGPEFAAADISWGINNGWSAYSGSVLSKDYQSVTLGFGRDLLMFGALSFDTTQSNASIPTAGRLKGNSYRLSYAKRFEDYSSQINFAGYRFSEENFLSTTDYLRSSRTGDVRHNSKQLYTVTFNKQFDRWNMSSFLNWSHQTYWDREATDRYEISAAHHFDFAKLRNVSASLSAYRNLYDKKEENGIYVSFSLPWGKNSAVSYNAASTDGKSDQRASFVSRNNARDNYQVSVGQSSPGGYLSGYYSHEGDKSLITANASYQQAKYSAFGLSAQGGLTLTSEGGALHRTSLPGSARLLVDTDGVADVPVRGFGSNTNSNTWGKAVISDINHYHRSRARIDLDALSDNTEVMRSVVQATLTEGAIGYRKFTVLSGSKSMAVLRMVNGEYPPFGAQVRNNRQQQTGIIAEQGAVYLSGLRPGEIMHVEWNGDIGCSVTIPGNLPALNKDSLFLPCLLPDEGMKHRAEHFIIQEG